MPSIFPASGVTIASGNAQNTVDVATQNCAGSELFHSTTRCTPRFDPAAANAVMSELLNAVAGTGTGNGAQSAGRTWDCSRLDNLRVGIRDFVRNVIRDGCYGLDDIGAECDIQEVAFVADDAGCGRLVKVTTQPLPNGHQRIVEQIDGTSRIVFDGANNKRSAALEAFFPAGIHVYPVFGDPLVVNLDRDDFCGLSVSGTRLRAIFEASMGYFMDVDNTNPGFLGAYQYGTAIILDGVVRYVNTDSYVIDRSGNNGFVSDNSSLNFETSGTDMVAELIPFVRVDTGGATYDPTDAIEVDMGKAYVTWERR